MNNENETNEQLGRRAMDCADDFQWEEGMRDGDADNVCVGATESNGLFEYRWANSGGYISEWCELDGEEWPDFDDWATEGCLLNMVCRKWGVRAVPRMVLAESYDVDGGRLEILRDGNVTVFRATGGSRVERLVRALEAEVPS